MLYLDHAATTVVRPEVRAAMAPYLDEHFGNPSGIHQVSQRAKNALEEAREQAAELLGADRPLEIVFTGGGTEADNLGVAGPVMAAGQEAAVVTSATEHEAVLETAAFLARLGHPVSILPVDHDGRISLGDLAAALTPETRVVSIMAANNETGVLQPVAEVAAIVHDAAPRAVVHTDAVQAFIAEDITVVATGADLIALASHKLGGPKGVGLLYVRNGVELEPIVHGGGQELGRRSGTQNVAGIVGMVAAMEASVADRQAFRQRVAAARNGFEAALQTRFPDLEINAPVDARLPQHAHVRIPHVASETLLIRLDQADVAAAAGSACQSGAVEMSHVLAAMGRTPNQAEESVRFSFGWVTQPEDGSLAGAIVADVAEALR